MGEYILSFIVLNYRNARLTEKCYSSVAVNMRKIDVPYEFIVIDNSAGGAVDALDGLPRDVMVIRNSENKGFACGCNQGIKKSKGNVIVLLNNDAFVNADCIEAGLKCLRSDPSVGIWAPQLVNENGRTQTSAGSFPSLRSIAQEYLGIFKAQTQPNQTEGCPHEVETVTGACMMIPREVIDSVGLLDEEFFFTSEDIDYCARVKSGGFRTIYDPTVRAIHLGNSSQPWEWENDPHLHKCRIIYFRKHGGLLKSWIAFCLIQLGLAKRRLRKEIRLQRKRAEKAL